MSQKVVIDTNVLVSALISTKGNAAIILGMISDGLLESIYCQGILEEYSEVLSRPHFGFPYSRVAEALEIFTLHGTPIEPQQSNTYLVDESDRIFFDAALSSAATLITGNLKHYPEKPFIKNPAGFLSTLSTLTE